MKYVFNCIWGLMSFAFAHVVLGIGIVYYVLSEETLIDLMVYWLFVLTYIACLFSSEINVVKNEK